MDHEELMWRHKQRQEETFVPYMFRPSYGRCHYEDDGTAVRVILAVAGLGTVVLTVVPRYNVTSNRLWNQDAVMSAHLENDDARTA